MADEDLKTMLREFRASVSDDLATVHRSLEEFKDETRQRFATMETAILNEIRDLGGRLERVASRVGDVERRLGPE
jgi:hypothetical protein